MSKLKMIMLYKLKQNNTNLDVNIRGCEHLTLRIEDARSNFRVELNGVVYNLDDSGTKLVSKTL